jgi:uncharacterized delta-60 repeat protein
MVRPHRPRSLARVLLACSTLVALCASAAAPPAPAATSVTVVGATVPTATSLNAAACATGTPATSFGVVMPGSSAITSTNCRLTFGSSNGQVLVRAYQRDQTSVGMFQYTSGAMDTAFDSDGIATTPVGAAADSATAAAVQKDGKVVLAGFSDIAGTDKIRVVRLTSAGTLDAGFATGGVYSRSLSGSHDRAQALLVQTDGSMLVAGVTNDIDKLFILKLTAAGVLDTTYGTGGTTILETGGYDYLGTNMDLVARPNGGVAIVDRCTLWEVCLTGVTDSGVLDATFGTAGFAAAVTPSGSEYSGVAVMNDGILVAAERNDNHGLYLDKFGFNGAFDATFGTGGVKDTGYSAQGGMGVGVQQDQKIIIQEGACCSPKRLRRLLPNGSPDATFGIAGAAPLANGALQIQVLQDDSIVVGNSDGASVQLQRFTPNGADDTTFGTNGQRTIAAPNPMNPWLAPTLTEGIDGAIVVGGSFTVAGNQDVGAIVTKGWPVNDYGSTTWTPDANAMFGVCLLATSATSLWPTTGSCTATNGTNWRATPISPADPNAGIARTTSDAATGATIDLRFGMRVPSSQRPGRYVAPLTFDVIGV